MPEGSRTQQETRSLQPKIMADALQAMIETWQPVSTSLQAWNGRCTATAAELCGEWTEFVARRLKEDIELPGRLAASRTLEDVWRTYTGFWQRLASDYQQEMQRLARIGGEHAQASLEAFHTSTKEKATRGT